MPLFQANVFQHNVFQGPYGSTATAAVALYGAWGGGLNAKRKRHTPGQPRKLSELDPKPVFSPEEVLETVEVNEQTNIDPARVEAAAMDALAMVDAKIGESLRAMAAQKERARLALLADDDDNFIMVM